MNNDKVVEIIARLRVVKKEKGYSYQKIVDMTEEIGEAVSLSTVKRVFSEEHHEFRWATIRPIATVLLGVGFETPEPDDSDPDQPQKYYAVIEGLKAIVEAKGEMIDSKNESIKYLEKQLRRQQIITSVLTIILGSMMIVAFVNHGADFFWLG